MVRKSASGRIGIADVALKAGVSHATVSRVMNGNFTVDPEIAARVKAAAADLKYQPNPVGRSLALGKTDTIGIVVPDLANPTFQAILRGLSRAAAQDGYRVLIADSFEVSSEESILAGEARRRCDGLVLCAPRMSDAELEELAPSLRPLVLINRTTAAADVPSLVVDYGQGVQDIAEHLVELGHTRLAFLAGPPRSASNNLRLQGLEAFKAAHPHVEVTMLEGGSDFDTGHGSVDAVLESGATGILAFNDLVAMGLMSGLHERGLDVPGDISVTGFDDIPFAKYTTPTLTTAAVPITELGAEAWHQLRALIRNEASQTPGSRYQPRLEVRASTGPAKAARTAVHG
ncbi:MULTISPECIES: LacI family DNA-binding transcriptional regulator [Micrococcaceae]|jgi:LacI family transcriptional regulator|uniref:LacI family DNA-binding transcriptional regulator n=1 Tax=Micrococcaceae TaxID=1268 RepID=UPI0012F76DF8|nr:MULTISPECIES: LacI family DNA-binding transcriptional regulator [Pseudarthrobacter]MEA3550061.1 LacI family DNA-binding transcriptional regulator [Pseudarthrobacter sp. C1]MUU72248.1 LacI family DNA-binding transcriptional regulator [Pseudarthrobacter sp. GA104]WPU08758.1 LacI family DNA-binding transcriptional regulator [Pseudarthrobacter oxydans]HET7782044.1 LacI family DNA-binding transcriptional regulator [Arthrobacter sp.]